MRLETELNIALTEFFRPIVAQCVKEALQHQQPAPATTATDASPYGDFTWLARTCDGIPESTLRQKSATREIPGIKKVGKRVLYHKASVLSWLNDQTPAHKPTAAEEQFIAQLDKRKAA